MIAGPQDVVGWADKNADNREFLISNEQAT